MIKRFIIATVLLSLLVFAVFWFQNFRSKILKNVFDNMAQPPASITTVIVKKEKWEQELKTIGTFTSFQGVTLSAEESGKVVKLNFDSGQAVQKGDLLAQQDIAVEQSQLQSIQTQLNLALTTFKRTETLVKQEAATQAEWDDADSKVRQTQSELETLKSTIARKTILAPFSGRLGIRQIQVGQFLTPGTPLVSLQALNPIYIEFGIPQNEIAKIKVGQSIQVDVDAYANEPFMGKISAIQPEIDIATRNIHLQATLENAGEKLRPGMFGTVRIHLEESTEGIVVPLTAIQYAPYGDSVFVVEKGNDQAGKPSLTVRQEFVKLGTTRGDWVSILSGLKEGDEVATTGVFKLRPSIPVIVNNENSPTLSVNPSPVNQ